MTRVKEDQLQLFKRHLRCGLGGGHYDWRRKVRVCQSVRPPEFAANQQREIRRHPGCWHY